MKLGISILFLYIFVSASLFTETISSLSELHGLTRSLSQTAHSRNLIAKKSNWLSRNLNTNLGNQVVGTSDQLADNNVQVNTPVPNEILQSASQNSNSSPSPTPSATVSPQSFQSTQTTPPQVMP